MIILINKLEYKQTLPMNISEAWEFFSNPNNLAKITPKEMSFKVTSKTPEKIYAGLIITYIIKPLFNFPVTWITEISHMEESKFFVDEQRFGPYKFWHHQHIFEDKGNYTEMTDIVHYAVPFGILGKIMNKILINKKVKGIFTYREKILKELFK